MEILLSVVLVCLLLIAVTVARMPTLSIMAYQKRWEWELDRSYLKQKETSRKIAASYRSEAVNKIAQSLILTAICSIILVVALYLYLSQMNGIQEPKDILIRYLDQKFDFVFRRAASAESVGLGVFSDRLDTLVSINLIAMFGSLGIYFASSIASVIFLTLFPVRWLKAPQHSHYLDLYKVKGIKRVYRWLLFYSTSEFAVSKDPSGLPHRGGPLSLLVRRFPRSSDHAATSTW